MYEFKRVLVCLDLSDADDDIIKSINLRSKFFPIDHITFIHVVKDLELPKEITEKYPDLIAPVDETCEKMIEDTLSKYQSDEINYDYDIEIVEGNPTNKILKWASIKEADLIVVGKKPTENGSGILTEKIARLAHCSVAVIPKPIELKVNHAIFVPIDFSENSKMALEIALDIHRLVEDQISVVCQHGYRVPTGYHSTGKSYSEFAEIMKHNAENDFKMFMKKNFPDVENIRCIYSLDEENNPAKLAHDVALQENADFIIMGSKGRTGIASFLLGSVTEKMIKYDLEIPLVIIKDKRDEFGFLDAIKKI